MIFYLLRVKYLVTLNRKEENMKKYNVIVVYDQDYQKVLMCLRIKNPFLGLYNFVGGKIEENEESIHAAYRELEEETHINANEISLVHTHDFYYYLEDMILEIWAGQLKMNKEVFGDENQLEWIDLNENFFDFKRFAGYGNIGHILQSIHLNKDKIIK